MAFICTLGSGELRPRLFSRGSSVLVTDLIGFDDAEELVYEVRVSLEPQIGGIPELCFWLEVLNHSGDAVETIWSGFRSRFITKPDRVLILNRILHAIDLILKEMSPESIHLATVDVHPPDKAKQKFITIARFIEMCGYRVQRYDEYHGQCLWAMERLRVRGVDQPPRGASA